MLLASSVDGHALMSTDDVSSAAGAITTLVGIAWSLYDKHRRHKEHEAMKAAIAWVSVPAASEVSK